MSTDRETAISNLYSEHSDEVWKSVRRHVRGVDDEVINDACANAWMACFRAAGFDPAASHAVGYVILTACREGWALAKKLGRDVSLDAMEGFDPAAEPERVEDIAAAIALMDGLTDNQKKAVWAFHVVGLSYAETMQALGWTHTQANRHINEGTRRMRKLRG